MTPNTKGRKGKRSESRVGENLDNVDPSQGGGIVALELLQDDQNEAFAELK